MTRQNECRLESRWPPKAPAGRGGRTDADSPFLALDSGWKVREDLVGAHLETCGSMRRSGRRTPVGEPTPRTSNCSTTTARRLLLTR